MLIFIKAWRTAAREVLESLQEWRVERRIVRELCGALVARPELRDVPMVIVRDLAKLHTAAFFAAHSMALGRLAVATENDLVLAEAEAEGFADAVLTLACRGEEEETPAPPGARGPRNRNRGARRAPRGR